jgi:hypothetical protein
MNFLAAPTAAEMEANNRSPYMLYFVRTVALLKKWTMAVLVERHTGISSIQSASLLDHGHLER